MSRLIDADVLKAIYDPSSYEGHGPNENWDNVVSTFEEIRTDIDDQPTIDAVPVVRCKNCEYGEIEDPEFPDQYFCHAHGCDWNEGDHFCSNGKEKVKERR